MTRGPFVAAVAKEHGRSAPSMTAVTEGGEVAALGTPERGAQGRAALALGARMIGAGTRPAGKGGVGARHAGTRCTGKGGGEAMARARSAAASVAARVGGAVSRGSSFPLPSFFTMALFP